MEEKNKCLKNDNDLHLNIMLSVGCYCDKVLDVSLPNESGCSVMCVTKTFGRTCHPPLSLVNEHGKSIYVLLLVKYRAAYGETGDMHSRDEATLRNIEYTEIKDGESGGT